MIEPMKSIIGTEVEQVNRFVKGTSKVVVLSMDAGLEICRKLNEVIEHVNKSENLVLDEKKFAELLSQKKVTVFQEGGVVGFRTNQWIPCSERLPEKYGEYLCCDKHGEYIIGCPTARISSDDYYVETEHEIMNDCVAWMPLPEPYKEEGACDE